VGATGCGVADRVTISLRASAPATLAVVRGCTSSCPVAVSTDGTTFTPVGAATSEDAVVDLPGTPIVGVRISHDISALREVSVWAAVPATALTTVSSKLDDQIRAPYGSGHGHRHRGLVIGIAGVLLAFVLLGVGFSLGRRRRS
jgi:hypothetical protein